MSARIRFSSAIMFLLAFSDLSIATDHVTSVTGKVGYENQPLENVEVSLYRGDHLIWQTATDELGSFSFYGIKPGTYSAKVVYGAWR
jgi:hypothetical protein